MSRKSIEMLTCLCNGEPYLAYHGEWEYIGRCCVTDCDIEGKPSDDCEKETAKKLWNDMIISETDRIMSEPPATKK